MKPALRKALEKQHYGIVGNHSAVEICSWCKKSLRDEGVCYKQQFYGIKSHRCCQMTPTAGFCNFKCQFCWRAHELNEGIAFNGKCDDSKTIIDGCIAEQKRLLTGFGGNEKANKEKVKESQEPMHFALSLTGEPTLFPNLPELIKALHKRGKTTFLVTNGTQTEMLRKLKREKALPTQLYLSLDAPTKEMQKNIDIPLISDAWERINKTIELLPKLDCRKVIRITLIRGLNDSHVKDYAKLIKTAAGNDKKTMLEVKAYMWVGHSRKRLKKENMPTHKDCKDFAEKLVKELNWKIIDEHTRSRAILIVKEDFQGRVMSFD